MCPGEGCGSVETKRVRTRIPHHKSSASFMPASRDIWTLGTASRLDEPLRTTAHPEDVRLSFRSVRPPLSDLFISAWYHQLECEQISLTQVETKPDRTHYQSPEVGVLFPAAGQRHAVNPNRIYVLEYACIRHICSTPCMHYGHLKYL